MAEQVAIKPGTEIYSVFKKVVSHHNEDDLDQAVVSTSMKELYENIHDAYLEWQSALSHFETAECKEMVDYFSYRIKASQIRYEYLLRKAKDHQTQ